MSFDNLVSSLYVSESGDPGTPESCNEREVRISGHGYFRCRELDTRLLLKILLESSDPLAAYRRSTAAALLLPWQSSSHCSIGQITDLPSANCRKIGKTAKAARAAYLA